MESDQQNGKIVVTPKCKHEHVSLSGCFSNHENDFTSDVSGFDPFERMRSLLKWQYFLNLYGETPIVDHTSEYREPVGVGFGMDKLCLNTAWQPEMWCPLSDID